MEYIDLSPISRVNGTLSLPGSKSISNRILLLSALAKGTTTISNLLHADDTHHMLKALTQLGVKHDLTNDHSYCIEGINGKFPVENATLFLGNAGTAFRPLTAVLALMQGEYTLHGTPRMHERPIGHLVDALAHLGAKIHYLNKPGFPPLHIQPGNLIIDRPIPIQGSVSSQFLSALLMALPLLNQTVTIEVIGQLISKPYIEITLALMQQFGISVIHHDWQQFQLTQQQSYQSPGHIVIEGDASSASYFLAAGAIKGGTVTVNGIGKNSIQGDKAFADVLAKMGAMIRWTDHSISASPPPCGKLQALDIDLNHIPDAAMTLAVAALFAEGTTTLRNIGSWQVKETDRILAMATELKKVGAIVETGEDYIRIIPPQSLISNATIDTYDDHRMAMCFSLVALGDVPIRINDPACVNKTFPDYFEALTTLIDSN